VNKLQSWALVSEETLIDMGFEPSPGYWRRQEARIVARRKPSTRLRIAVRRLQWALASIPHRLIHARDALAGRDCSRED
jgi:hypothetical protein